MAAFFAGSGVLPPGFTLRKSRGNPRPFLKFTPSAGR